MVNIWDIHANIITVSVITALQCQPAVYKYTVNQLQTARASFCHAMLVPINTMFVMRMCSQLVTLWRVNL